jgi:hypothetical protein
MLRVFNRPLLGLFLGSPHRERRSTVQPAASFDISS